MDNQELYDEMMTWPGYEFESGVRRDDHEDTGHTFSADAMEELNRTLMIFVGTRIMREWQKEEKAPKILKVQISVAFE